MVEEKKYLTETEREHLTSLLNKLEKAYLNMSEREKGVFEGALIMVEYRAARETA